MKNLLKLSFLVGFIFISASVSGKNKDFSLSILNVASKTINFEVLTSQNVSLFVYNDKDGELFSEKINKDLNVAKSYNLENFPAGTYYLVAESDYRIERYKISISNEEVLVDKTPVSEVNKPVYFINGNKVNLHLNNLDKEAKISVTDLSNNVYYSENKKGINGELNITFDLDPATSDAYVISVEKNGDSFNKIISLKQSF